MSFQPMSMEPEKGPTNREACSPEDMALLKVAHLRYAVTRRGNVDE